MRNKLAAEKVHNTGVVKTDLRRAHTAAGLTRKRRKRAFGQDGNMSPDQTPDSGSVDTGHEDVDIRDLMNELIHDADEDANDEDDVAPTQPVPPMRPGARTPAQRRIPLALLFSFTDVSSAASLEFYWKGGLKNMQRETAAYDMMHEEGAVEMAIDISTNPGDKDAVDSGVFS